MASPRVALLERSHLRYLSGSASGFAGPEPWRPPPEHRRSNRLLWMALFASLFASVAIAEVVVRLWVPPGTLPKPPSPSTIDAYAENPYIVTRRPYLQMFLPGARYRATRPAYVVDYEINSHGFRGPEIGPKTGRRLLVIGDSVPEGHGIPFEQGLAARLDYSLEDAGWSVVSAAMQGSAPLNYATNLPRYLDLEPDAVLLILFENDLFEDRQRESGYFDHPILEEAGGLRLWTLGRAVFAQAFDSDLERLIRANQEVELPKTEPDPITQIIVPPELFARSWAMSAAYLDTLADELEEREVPLFVTVLALGTLVPRVPATHHTHARSLEDKARAWARERGLPFLSLFPVVERALAELPWEQVMIPDDGHPTIGMHRRFASTLEPWLRSHLP